MRQERVAFWSCLIVGVLGAATSLYLFVTGWKRIIAAEIAAGSPTEAVIVTYVFPMLTDLEIIAGIGLLVAAYGFATRKNWAWLVGVASSVIGLMPSFFQMIPPLSRGLFPAHIVTYLPYLFMYCLLLLYVRPVGGKIFILSFLAGVTYVLTFMNGIASIERILSTGLPVYVPSQQLNWVAAIAWAVFSVAVVFRKKWALPLGLGAGLLGALAGTPLGLLSTLTKGGLSMFYPAPILNLFLFLILVIMGERLFVDGSNRVNADSQRLRA
jgi:hypothetical protein